MTANNISGYNAYKNIHLAVVKAEQAAGMDPIRPNSQTARRTTAGVSYGSAVGIRSKEKADIRAVALRYDDFETAVLPMVLASDRTLSGKAAVAVAHAILGNDQLRAQAERAFNTSREAAK
jgi:hypothetical protein